MAPSTPSWSCRECTAPLDPPPETDVPVAIDCPFCGATNTWDPAAPLAAAAALTPLPPPTPGPVPAVRALDDTRPAPHGEAADEAADTSSLPPGYDRVYTVTDWYDGPRAGIADVAGVPHRFAAAFADVGSNAAEEELFLLWPVSAEELALAREDWEIWRRWETAFHAGEATIDTHPALPADRPRHEALQRRLRAARDEQPAGEPTRARAAFRPSGADNGHASLLVRWSIDLDG